MHAALAEMRETYKVPEGIPALRVVDDPNYYYSPERLKRTSKSPR